MKPRRIKYSSHDYQYSSLPTNRKEAFKDVYRHNFRTILFSGGLLLLFALPLIIFNLVMDVGRLGMTLEHYSEEELYNVLLLWDIIVNVGSVILFFAFLVSFAGVFRIIRQLIWQEGISFWHDFKRGIKENYPIMSLLSGIVATIYLATYFVQLFFLQFFIGLTLIIIFMVVFISVYLWSIMMSGVYQTKLFVYVKNGFFFTSKSIGWTLLYVLMSTLPFLSYYLYFLSFSGSLLFVILKYVIITIMVVMFYPMMLIVGLLFANSKFDTFINQENYPEYYRKGLYDPTKKQK